MINNIGQFLGGGDTSNPVPVFRHKNALVYGGTGTVTNDGDTFTRNIDSTRDFLFVNLNSFNDGINNGETLQMWIPVTAECDRRLSFKVGDIDENIAFKYVIRFVVSSDAGSVTITKIKGFFTGDIKSAANVTQSAGIRLTGTNSPVVIIDIFEW